MEAGKEQRRSKLLSSVWGKPQDTPLKKSKGKLSTGTIETRATSSLFPGVGQSHGEGQETLARAHHQHPVGFAHLTSSPLFLRATAQYLERETEAQRCEVVV